MRNYFHLEWRKRDFEKEVTSELDLESQVGGPSGQEKASMDDQRDVKPKV